MEAVGNFLLLLIRQFAGGPGPMENNLMRFGLSAIFWLVLLGIAWSRQREQDLPRERLLIWGFGFAMVRELIMFGMTTGKITGIMDPGWDDIYFFPIENGLNMAALVVVAGAFLQYILQDNRISNRYLQIGLLITILTTIITYFTWPGLAKAEKGLHFSGTWESRAFHLETLVLLIVGIILLIRKRGSVSSIASLGLMLVFISEFLFLVSNWVTIEVNHILCPISNAFHILAIPVFGFVYLKEMSLEKKQVEDRLDKYRNQLEELVDERTSMLVAQHEIVDSLSQTLDLETVLNMALDKVLTVLSMEVGLIFLLDRERGAINLEAYRGRISPQDLELCIREGCLYEQLSLEAIRKQVIIQKRKDESMSRFTHLNKEQLELVVSVPLITKDQVIGAITIGSRNPDPLDSTFLELLSAVGHQIGMAVENAYLYHEAEIWANELSTLHKASISLGATLDAAQINSQIAIQSASLTGRPMACVIYRDDRCKALEVISSVGISQKLLLMLAEKESCCDLLNYLYDSGTSVVINDISQDPRVPQQWGEKGGVRSLMCTPIWDVDEPVEFLFILDTDETRSWRLRDIELVESFVSRAAVALENANLYKQLEWAATLEERQRIAAEMHDGLAQSISLVGLKVDKIVDLLPPEPSDELKQAIRTTRATVGQALVEARKSISSLHTNPEPRRSLQDILTTLVEQWSVDWPGEEGVKVTTSFNFANPLYLEADQVSQIVPIVQEAIINAHKHSRATEIHVAGNRYEDHVQIIVEDNGDGFNVEKSFEHDEHHFGLKIMLARAERFGGSLQVISEPDSGTKIKLSWVHRQEKNGVREVVETEERSVSM